MESLFNKLPDLSEREVKVIRKLTKSIVNQMLHDPINRIKEMAAGKNGEEALEMFVQFFALEERVKELGAAVGTQKNRKKRIRKRSAFRFRPIRRKCCGQLKSSFPA